MARADSAVAVDAFSWPSAREWTDDRLGRSLQDLIGFLSELHALRIDLFLHQQGLDTTTPPARPFSR
jgi:hypothetical protein